MRIGTGWLTLPWRCLFWFSGEAAVAWGAGEELVMEEVEVGPPQPHEIRIKVVCSSLCRSDLSAWETQVKAPSFPLLLNTGDGSPGL